MRLNGALVAPTSGMSMGGNSDSAPGGDKPRCNVFVVASMELKGNTSLSAAGCDTYGTNVNQPRIARVVE